MTVSVRPAHWAQDASACLRVRRAVFIEEQQVPEAIEIDGRDPQCRHALAWHEDTPIGTGRLLPDGHIGRVAVLREWRGQGVGAALMRVLETLGREQGHPRIELAAQCSAEPFYRQLGYAPVGEPFVEAGIDHITMTKTLDPQP